MNACWPGRVFQIDGNFSGTAGIAEMLLQSHGGQVHFLPVLPKAWPDGKGTGLCARGGCEVGIEWQGGKLTRAVVRSAPGGPVHIRYEGQKRTVDIARGSGYSFFP
jgi:alpha-L-fucosidase 2